MTTEIQFKRRIAGAAGSPSATGALEGEIAFNAPNAAGSTDKPVMYFFDGSAWRTVNPDVTVTTQSIALGAAANIGAAYTTWAATPGNTLTGNVIIATYGTPAQAYVLTNPAAAGTSTSWVSLGGAVSFASASDIHTGTDTTGAINSAILRGETTLTSTGAADANKLVRLGATGKLDATLLPVTGVDVIGAADVTAAIPGGTTYNDGDIVFVSANGSADASWTGIGGQVVASGDMVIYDGAQWHHVPNYTDLNAYLALAGGTMSDGAKITFDVTTGGAGTVVADGAGGAIDNFRINCGVF